MEGQVRTNEQIAGRIAGCAHGVATRGELLAAGLSRAEVDRRVRQGFLLVEFRGVYLVGHRPRTPETRYMAAVKACREGAVQAGGDCAGRAPSPPRHGATPTPRAPE
jgi:hypothetical protein